MNSHWNKFNGQNFPQDGTIVELEIKKKTCSCGGYYRKECYYDNGIFSGIKDPTWIHSWRVSKANDLIKEIEQRKCIIAQDCPICLS